MTASLYDHRRDSVPQPIRWTLGAAVALVGAFLVSLIARHTGSYTTALDGWGVAAFEMSMGVLCLSRYFDRSWRSGQSFARLFPVVLGTACISWAIGDTVLTIESLGGASPSVPSAADAFYLGFFPIAYLSFMMVIRRGTASSLIATSLDALVAGLAASALAAAYLFSEVKKVSGGGTLSVATNLAYPIGDLLLLSLAVGGIGILPKGYRRFLGIAAAAMAANGTGDVFNLLQVNSKIGYISNAIAWPISLLLLAAATWTQPADAWVPPENSSSLTSERRAGFVLPATAALAAMVVLLTASLAHTSRAAVGLAAATLFVAGLRLTMTVRDAQALTKTRFRSLIDNAWDLILVAEADLEVAYVTPSARRVLGYAPSELQGQPLISLLHPDDVSTLSAQLTALAERGGETAAFETRVRHQNGEWRIIAWTVANLLDNPSVGGFVLNGGDVTEARLASADLAGARDEALKASRAKSEFLSTMSHEIRTPMNGVIGLTDLLLETDLNGEQYELASGVKVSAESLLAIINDILDFSKIEAGKLEVEETELNVPALADDVGRILATSAHEKGLELLIDVHPDVPTALVGDLVRVKQVLLNLGSNAVKFTSEGEVVLRVSMLHQNAERVALRFEVIDDGIGVAPVDQERLFGAFSQADSSTTRRFGGTGLGLAISRQLVDLMGGKLGLVSAPGEGSTFWFELSLRRAQTEITVLGSAPPDLAGRKALIVDDNATNRKIVRQQLLSWGVEPVEACDGYEATGLAAEAAESGSPFDLGVIDLNMPGMDGVELAEILKGDPATANTMLFLLSSSGNRLSAAECHLRGFEASLTKPVRQSELFDCLITACNQTIQTTVAEAADLAPRTEEAMGTVLLVEDNKMNQLVGSKALAKLGYSYDIANDGKEAVRAVQTRTYDAIFMDCQMPEMDGYEATAIIRNLEGQAHHTPIIAMTAAAMDGDREKCLAAGMDDYITKPIRLEVVATVLQRWLSGSPYDRDNGCASIGADSSALDPAQIDFLRGLDDGDGSVLREIIDEYLDQVAESREELGRLVEQGDVSTLARTAHKLRGASANMGAGRLVEVCADIEASSERAEFGELARLVERFDTEFARVREALGLVAAGR